MKSKIKDDDLKKIQLEILMYFRDVCEKNGFKYSLFAGTLLGAVRHKGFIPWDDDIDVCMPRDDYDSFVKYCKTHELKYELFCHEIVPHYGVLFAKLSDNNTLLVEHVADRKDLHLGVNIDIFIYDAMGNTLEEAKRKFNKTRFIRELLVAANWEKYSRSKTHSWYYEFIRFPLFLLSRFSSPQNLVLKIESIYKATSFYDVRYVGNLSSDGRSRSIIQRSYFDNYVELEFEGENFKVFEGYKVYLKTMYGDYMQLPPPEKRISHHSFDAYYK